MDVADQGLAEANSVGPNWIRTEHTAEEFNRVTTARVRAAVPRLVTLERAMIRGTTEDGKTVYLDFRTRMDGSVVYAEGRKKGDYGYDTDFSLEVTPKEYKGSLARFKTMVHTGGLPNAAAVKKAKKAIEDLFK